MVLCLNIYKVSTLSWKSRKQSLFQRKTFRLRRNRRMTSKCCGSKVNLFNMLSKAYFQILLEIFYPRTYLKELERELLLRISQQSTYYLEVLLFYYLRKVNSFCWNLTNYLCTLGHLSWVYNYLRWETDRKLIILCKGAILCRGYYYIRRN